MQVKRIRSLPGFPRRTAFRLAATLKSCNRIFDVPCEGCDKISAAKARSKWQKAVSGPSFAPETSNYGTPWLLRRRVRELTEGWGKLLRSRREGWEEPNLSSVYVPDQQGCYETARREGGTLATAEADFSPSNSVLRVGVAKTKGKFRVVTMQPALVKRVLTPVHNALYDHISSFDWCVRGDVSSATFAGVVSDLRDGESFISGDYASASDGIYPWATSAMVDALLEEEGLTDLERRILRESFENLSWVSKSGVKHPIVRGQMMGSLVGFPLLCLLNKACFDIACDIRYGSPFGKHWRGRIGRFNGDDCCFAGDDDFFSLWRRVTSTFGLTVNEEKTGICRRFIELNSHVFDAKLGKMIAKPVLSFLRPDRYDCRDLLAETIKGCSTLKPAVRMWVVNVLMRYEISCRPINVQSLSRPWLKILVKRKWFRTAVANPPQVLERGDDRSLPVVLGPMPKPELLEEITSIHCLMVAQNNRYWTGRPAKPLERRLVRRKARERLFPFPRVWVRFGKPRWRFLWPTELLREVVETSGFLSRNAFVDDDFARSCVDHPFVHLEWTFWTTPLRNTPRLYSAVPPPLSLLSGVKRPPARPFEESGGVNLWSVKRRTF